MTSSSGWSLLSDRVTPNGRKFIAFISLNDWDYKQPVANNLV
jgi:hypothetical protein